MTFTLDPECAQAIAPMAEAMAAAPPRAVGDIEFHLHPGIPYEFDSIAFDSDVARRAVAHRVRVLKSI